AFEQDELVRVDRALKHLELLAAGLLCHFRAASAIGLRQLSTLAWLGLNGDDESDGHGHSPVEEVLCTARAAHERSRRPIIPRVKVIARQPSVNRRARGGRRPCQSPPRSLSRLPLLGREEMGEPARRFYDAVTSPESRTLAGLQGPSGVWLHSPELGELVRA